jgi:prepilin-type N-terminal cleavage/methylation domain-containing protein
MRRSWLARGHSGRARPLGARTDEAGFSLVEVLVAIALIGIVMSSLGAFFVTSMVVTSAQAGTQAAVQVANDGMERVRTLAGSAAVEGRDTVNAPAQWNSPVTGVSPYLDGMVVATDGDAAAGAGATATLPTSPVTKIVNGVEYKQHWYVGECWQPAGGGTCAPAAFAGALKFFGVAVAVTWSEKSCDPCSYVTTTLLGANGTEPLFNETVPPRVVATGAKFSYVGTTVTPVQLFNEGGLAPFTWAPVSGMPPGVSVNGSGLLSGTPTAAGDYNVVVSVTDDLDRSATVSFAWQVKPALTLTNPGTRNNASGTAITPVGHTAGGGYPPYTWSQTGLPAGLSLDGSTGVVSGTPTTVGASSVTITVTDSRGATRPATFTWNIAGVLDLVDPGDQTSTAGVSVTRTLTRTGGAAPFAFTQTGLPAGLSISATTGTISGTPTSVGTANVTVKVTDATGQQDTVAFTWTRPVLSLTTPPSQTSDNDITITPLQLGVAGGVRPYTWSQTGLPAGLTIDVNGRITGRATTVGTYSVRIRVTDASGVQVYTGYFTWRVNN